MTLKEKLTISDELPDFLHEKIEGSSMAVRRKSRDEDYCSFSITSDKMKLPRLSVYIDLFYQRKGFSLSPLSTSVLPNFTLRTYKHLSGSSSQAMIAQEKSEFYFFVEDRETEQQRKIRMLLENSVRGA